VMLVASGCGTLHYVTHKDAKLMCSTGEGLRRLEYRVGKWDKDFAGYLATLRARKPIIVNGDLNCAHHEIDLHSPKTNLCVNALLQIHPWPLRQIVMQLTSLLSESCAAPEVADADESRTAGARQGSPSRSVTRSRRQSWVAA